MHAIIARNKLLEKALITLLPLFSPYVSLLFLLNIRSSVSAKLF